MNRARLVEYAVSEVRALGRRLVSGSWARSAVPMQTTEALSVIAEAIAIVLEEGTRSVLNEGRRKLRELAARWEIDD